MSNIKNKLYYLSVMIVAFFVAFVFADVNYLIANIRRVSVALAFIILGYLGKDWFRKESVLLFIIAAICTIVIAFANKTVGIAIRQFNNPALFVLGGFSGSYAVLYIARRAVSQKTCASVLKNIGKASLVIMGTHQNVLIPFTLRLGNWTSYKIKLLILLTTVIVEFVVVRLCKKWLPAWVGA